MSAPVPAYTRLLLTGAAGVLGRALAPALRGWCGPLRLSDLPDALARLPAVPGDDSVPCDLADADAVNRLLHGVDAVVHLGGVSVEGPFAPILALLGKTPADEQGEVHNLRSAEWAGGQAPE